MSAGDIAVSLLDGYIISYNLLQCNVYICIPPSNGEILPVKSAIFTVKSASPRKKP